jgi:hypothetical protein
LEGPPNFRISGFQDLRIASSFLKHQNPEIRKFQILKSILKFSNPEILNSPNPEILKSSNPEISELLRPSPMTPPALP